MKPGAAGINFTPQPPDSQMWSVSKYPRDARGCTLTDGAEKTERGNQSGERNSSPGVPKASVPRPGEPGLYNQFPGDL